MCLKIHLLYAEAHSESAGNQVSHQTHSAVHGSISQLIRAALKVLCFLLFYVCKSYASCPCVCVCCSQTNHSGKMWHSVGYTKLQKYKEKIKIDPAVLRCDFSLNPWKHRPSCCCGAFVYLRRHWINSKAQMATPSPSGMWHQHQYPQLESGLWLLGFNTDSKMEKVCMCSHSKCFFFFFLMC